MKLWGILLSFALLTTCGCANMLGDADKLENQAAPMLFTGHWINEQQPPLDALHGYVVMIEFWSSTCPACKKAIPHINELIAKYSNYPFKVITVHGLKTESQVPDLEDAVVELGVKYPVLTDVGRNIQAIYKLDYLPAVYLIDKKGIVRYTNEGSPDFDEVQKKIDELLAESAS